MDLAHSAGHRIRDLRSRLGLSQEEVADRAAIHVLTLSNIERGASDPPARHGPTDRPGPRVADVGIGVVKSS